MFSQSQRRLMKQPIEPRRNTRTGRQVQQNARQKVTIGNGLTCDLLRKRRENYLTNHKGRRYLKQPIITRRKFTYGKPNAGKKRTKRRKKFLSQSQKAQVFQQKNITRRKFTYWAPNAEKRT